MSRTDPAQRNVMKMVVTVMAWLFRWGADAGRALGAHLGQGVSAMVALLALGDVNGALRGCLVSVVDSPRYAAGATRRSSLARGRLRNRSAAMARFKTF